MPPGKYERTPEIRARASAQQIGHWTPERRQQRSGEGNPAWVGGQTVSGQGYIFILTPGHPRATRKGYVAEHILVMEKKLGRYLVAGEVVHHIDHNKRNNHPDNLQLMTAGEHTLLHNKERWS